MIGAMGGEDSEIDPKDLRIDTFLSGVPGDEGVCSGVRITHIPTNTTVSCREGKDSREMRERAMELLRTRLKGLR